MSNRSEADSNKKSPGRVPDFVHEHNLQSKTGADSGKKKKKKDFALVFLI